MHADEVETGESLVHQLILDQFPQWAHLSITPVESAGTDNAIYRLGTDMVVRLPRIGWAVEQVNKEHEWLPRIASHLPLAIPVPIAKGAPASGYPWHWSVYQWLEGEQASFDRITDQCQAAIELARFLTDLQRIDTTGGPIATKHNVRGDSLKKRDTDTRKAITNLQGLIDTDAVTAVWEASLQAPEWERGPVWFHGDMLPGNVLIKQGRVCAVIDFGGLAIGDPACDLMIAWALFKDESREVFRKAMAVDDATWTRGRGHALCQALMFIPYYLHTNPVGVANALRTIDTILTEVRLY